MPITWNLQSSTEKKKCALALSLFIQLYRLVCLQPALTSKVFHSAFHNRAPMTHKNKLTNVGKCLGGYFCTLFIFIEFSHKLNYNIIVKFNLKCKTWTQFRIFYFANEFAIKWNFLVAVKFAKQNCSAN